MQELEAIVVNIFSWLNQKLKPKEKYPVCAAVAITKGPDKVDLDSNYYMYPNKYFPYKEQLSILEEAHDHARISDYLPNGYGFFAICDGMTNYRGSVYASHAVVTGLEEMLKESLEDSSYRVSDVQALLEKINYKICKDAKENASIEHMACSMSGLWVTPDVIRTVQIGNSSVWRFLDGRLTCLTRKHLRGAKGMPYFTNNTAIPEKNPLYSYMGIHVEEGVLVVDIDEVMELYEKEWFLLANQQLLDLVETKVLEEVLSLYYKKNDLLTAVKEVINLAKKTSTDTKEVGDLICMIVSVGKEERERKINTDEEEVKGEE